MRTAVQTPTRALAAEGQRPPSAASDVLGLDIGPRAQPVEPDVATAALSQHPAPFDHGATT
jgi:hypothetical protein